ncbi:GPW/gp25 family protein [Streptomyces sp. H27-C3]|uniref:GPW/gp25 family protein n=1 Tax=Streptomyces sp. H27-C3 TaxID=3046305 RepID=UPI0024B97973|nr:GPW/gp25 family protein [Streptomyces sp. H27-C3]MDJ0463146.1 GPW/gp25 family protein [Streptomyces sp. H27-C3]
MSKQLAIPFALDATGKVASVEHPDRQLSQRVRAVVAVAPTERVMQPEFGTDLRAFLFAANDAITRDAIRRTVQTSASRWEPKAVVKSIEPIVKDEEQGIADVFVDIGYSNTDPEATGDRFEDIVVRPGGGVDTY